MGTLFIVPTPIGNLEDITLRALRVLREVRLIAAEDTRTTGNLLRHYEIATPLTSYHEHNKLTKLDTIFDALAKGDVALVSDAGTPGISDPGYELISAALERDIRVEPLPGATAMIPALVASGLPTDEFIYLGFLPKKHAARRTALERMTHEQRTLIAYESPNRLLETLGDVQDVFGERPVCVAREVSKLYEEFQRGSVMDVLTYYRDHPLKGEIVLIIGGASMDDRVWDAAQVQAALDERLAAGEGLNAAAKAIAQESGWKKGDVYRLGIDA